VAQYTLPDLPYDYGALEPHLSGQILELHHDKHHAAYVTGANAAVEKLEEMRSKGEYGPPLTGVEKNLAFHVHLGSVDALKAQMEAVVGTVQGSGWAALSWEPLGQRLVVHQVLDHQDNVAAGSLPLFVIDAWEHAFYLQYKNVKADYAKAFWNIVNWADVAARFDKTRGVALP
jgi:Fe-Mn family superoxide dismutase